MWDLSEGAGLTSGDGDRTGGVRLIGLSTSSSES